MARNCIDVFHRYSFLNENNLQTYISPSNGTPIASLDHTWHNLNSQGYSYVVSPALSDHYAVCVIFRVKHNSTPKSIRFREYIGANAERFAAKFDSVFLYLSPLNSNPNEDAEYIVDFMKIILNKTFPIGPNTLTQRRLHSPWITSSIVKCVQKKHR